MCRRLGDRDKVPVVPTGCSRCLHQPNFPLARGDTVEGGFFFLEEFFRKTEIPLKMTDAVW